MPNTTPTRRSFGPVSHQSLRFRGGRSGLAMVEAQTAGELARDTYLELRRLFARVPNEAQQIGASESR
jgi:hypothetical protein